MTVVCNCCYINPMTTTYYLSSPFLGRSSPFLYLGKSPSRQSSRGSVHVHLSKISALFWGQRKTVQPHEMEFSLGTFVLTGSDPEGVSTNEMKPQKISLSVISSISEISSKDWDACAIAATGSEKLNPFLTHGFLSSLEESGCSVKETGWLPQHIIARNEFEDIVATHMENLFLIIPGRMPTTYQVSSLHVTFPSENEWLKMKEHGFLQRIGMQYHWKNRNYKNFDEFLMDMKQSKRKNIRQERKKISTQKLAIKRLRGDEIKARHWDSFYKFYRNTTDNKWGRAFLTRDFFHVMGEKMGDRVLLVVAEDGDDLVAGALNLIGGDTLFGRLWGCLPEAYYPSLHFEACYYQAIEAAIELNLSKVEAGAQGEHKIQRGYLPVTTYSSHYILDEGFRTAIADFLVRETNQVKVVTKLLHDSGPFKDDVQKSLEV